MKEKLTESGLRAEAERQNHAFADAVNREQPSRNSRPVSPQSHICKDFTSVAQTPDFTDIFYVSKIGQTVSSMSKIQHQWIAPKRSEGKYNCTIITYDSGRRVCLSGSEFAKATT